MKVQKLLVVATLVPSLLLLATYLQPAAGSYLLERKDCIQQGDRWICSSSVIINGSTSAVCQFAGTGSGDVKGLISISQKSGSSTSTFGGSLAGLTTGLHGLHVHQNGDLSDNCVGAGGHFNPYNTNHGSPNSNDRHVGDLGNVEADASGNVVINIINTLANLDGEENIIGKAMVIHEGEDDLGLGGDTGSLATGNAGGRAGCCLIQAAKVFVCKFVGTGSGDVSGLISISQISGSSSSTFSVNLAGLTTGKHGLHVHQNGDISDNCVGAGGHFNPYDKTHSSPTSTDRHVGDLGNVEADASGNVVTEIVDTLATLDGEVNIIGKAMVIHEGEDDLGLGGDTGSLATGNAGGRAGCCLIQEI